MLLWGAFLLLFQSRMALDLPSVRSNPHTTANDIALGRKLYAGRCAGCHGPAGDGGKGANLALPILPRGRDDIELYRTIRYGLAETEMPAHNMVPREIWQIAAFVRTLGQSAEGTAKGGDPLRGAALVRGKGNCLQCHIIDGQGGMLGPSLTDVGTRRSPSYLHAKMLDPKQELAGGFRLARLTTREGQTVSGVRTNEDTWSIQIRTMNGQLRSYLKDDLRDLKVEDRTPMPSYQGKLDDQELWDITAYLSSLGGRP